MPYKFNGTLKKVFPSTSGTSQNSGKEWTRKCALFSADEIKWGNKTSLDIYVSAWNKDCILLNSEDEGKECEVICRVESKEFNGRWMTDLMLEKIMFTDMFAPESEIRDSEPPDSEKYRSPMDTPQGDPGKDEDDDLPFTFLMPIINLGLTASLLFSGIEMLFV